ncbi:hypothetical protein AaE_012504 [Aphanomyces astaci]|uniref:Major facilitator superfamily (MFS) profile domain-containing protein n=4 Tax=Aphanomyces astaci TaxID=112090 RepID=A0A6A4Z7W6_APHAT|nr:hypothetical protein AaE_012504 [Aphanomyces astaci]
MFWKNPSALTQVLIVAMVCFTCPGLFNALNSIAAGVADETINYNATALLYACFALFGLFAGGAVNVIGPKYTLFIGTFGYIMYAASLLVMDKNYDTVAKVYSSGATAFFYASNAVIGISAGFLWTAQGQMCMAYPTSETKGTYFAYFWVIFNLGGSLGGFLSFATNYDNKGEAATTSTYVVFLILMSCGALFSLVLADPNNVVRNDGTMVKVERLPNPVSEFVATLKTFLDPKMLLMFPLFAYSNWFYQYHSFFNTSLFNTRSSSFASAFYWGSQMLGAFTVGKYLDRPGSKKPKALQSIFVIAVLIMLMWGSAMWVQVEFDLGNGKKDKNIDFQEGAFWLKFLLYMFYGFNDSIVQVWAYWLMGQFSDDMSTLGRYAGYYKCVQSGMAAVGWRLGGIPISPVSNIIVNWTLSTVGLVLAFISVKTYMEEKTHEEAYEGAETPKDKVLIAH